jgi:hypothetical protein
MKPITKAIYWALSMALITVGAILLYVDSVTLPSRYGSSAMELLPPATWLAAGMPIAFGLAIILHLNDSEKFKSICRAIVAAGLGMGFLGLVIVGPLIRG